MWQIEIFGWFVDHFSCSFQYRIDSLSLYITTSAWYYGMKILFRLGLLWLESIYWPVRFLSIYNQGAITILYLITQIQFWTKLVDLICFFIFCQALLHESVALDRKLVVDWVPSCDLEDFTVEEVSFIYALPILHFYILEN
jgi:hypothetical protein